MRLASWNVNGIRAIFRHGFLDWMKTWDPDVICLQETKLGPEAIPDEIRHPLGYHSWWQSAEKAGYSGVATLSRSEPVWVVEGLGLPDFDLEGRVLTTEFERFTLVNAYFPNSQDGLRLDLKLEFCAAMLKFLTNLRGRGKPVVLCGDFNIAHREIDVYNPRYCNNQAGYAPEERAWFEGLLALGYRDLFREQHPEPAHYSWWSYSPPSDRAKNKGWRIDYFVCSPDLEGVGRCWLQPEVMGSDHCPILLDLQA